MFKFKKIASLLASTIMVSSTVALAAAASYPAPFVQGGAADVAIVYGSHPAATVDLVGVLNIQDSLQSHLTGSTGSSTTSVSGEAYELFTSGSPILLNSTLDSVRQAVSASHLPTVLADGTFETTTSIEYTQRIDLGRTPILEFKQQPSSSDDPKLGFSLSTTASTGYIYNATVTFDENVNFTHADSVGEKLDLFGGTYTVGGATSTTKLVLLKSSQTIALTDTSPSAQVTVEDKTYTVDLISASDTNARIKVTDSNGNSDEKTIDESKSKTIKNLEVALDYCDENNQQYVATLLVGSSKMTFQDGASVKVGSDDTTIEGTQVEFEYTNGTASTSPGLLGKLIVQVTTDSSDRDAFFPGGSFVDPVWGTIKLDFSGITLPLDSTDREVIDVKNAGNDKMTVSFMSHDGTEAKSINWIYNKTDAQGGSMDLADNDKNRIVVDENAWVNKSEYVVLSSDDEGGLYQVTAIYNSSTGFADDYVSLKNMFTGVEKSYKATSEGAVTGVTEQGKTYSIYYEGASTLAQEKRHIRVDQGESTGAVKILFPTIATSKGAKIAFYEPTTLDLGNGDTQGTDVDKITFQDGDGYTYTDVDISAANTNITFTPTDGTGSAVAVRNTSGASATSTVGKLIYNFTMTDTANQTTVYLVSPQGGNIVRPALIIFEAKDEASAYEAMIVTLDAGYDGDSAGIGVSDVVRTWSSDALNDEVQLETDSDLYQDMDIWGSLMTLDKSDSDQTTASISYPKDQVQAEVYIAETSAAITSGSSGGSSTVGIPITDAEVSSAAGKNLIVVGGSCVNSVAATLLGSSAPLCGADFTTKTGVGSGEFLIETFDRTDGNVATIVAGYDASDTTNAAKYLTTQTVDTSIGKKYKGTTATNATLVTTA